MILHEAAAIAARARIKALLIDCLAVTASVYEKNGWAMATKNPSSCFEKLNSPNRSMKPTRPIAEQFQSSCGATLRWLISFSLVV
jgi:hypothetical protein